MVRWTIIDPFSEDTADVSLDVDNGNQPGTPAITGTKNLIKDIKSYLSFSSGAFGHQLSLDTTTAIDMDAALRSPDNPFSVEVSEGRSIVADYDPGIPEGDDT
jgi:hypothetical protein